MNDALDEVYGMVTVYVGFLTFASVWIGCIATYGFLFGVGLGWLPAIIVAVVVGYCWPVIVAVVVGSILFVIANQL